MYKQIPQHCYLKWTYKDGHLILQQQPVPLSPIKPFGPLNTSQQHVNNTATVTTSTTSNNNKSKEEEDEGVARISIQIDLKKDLLYIL
jgi:hypothetical protein